MTKSQPAKALSRGDETKPLLLIAAVFAGVVLNRTFGESLHSYTWLVRAGLFVVVFSIMAFVRIGNVGNAFRNPKPTMLAIVTNYIVVPGFAWLLGWVLLRNHPDLWAGVILYTLTPCIGWYLIFIDLAKGNMEWGLAMLPIDVILQTLLLPIYLWLFIGNVVSISFIALLGSVATFLLLPLLAAHLVRALITRYKGREFVHGTYRNLIDRTKLWSLVAVIIAVFATQPPLQTRDLRSVGFIVATITIFFIGIFLIALLLARVFQLDYKNAATLVFETTARNSESVIGIAASAFAGRPLVLLAIIIGPAIELPALLALTRVMLRIRTSWTWPIVETITPATSEHNILALDSKEARRLR
jgi:arsenite transporter